MYCLTITAVKRKSFYISKCADTREGESLLLHTRIIPLYCTATAPPPPFHTPTRLYLMTEEYDEIFTQNKRRNYLSQKGVALSTDGRRCQGS